MNEFSFRKSVETVIICFQYEKLKKRVNIDLRMSCKALCQILLSKFRLSNKFYISALLKDNENYMTVLNF